MRNRTSDTSVGIERASRWPVIALGLSLGPAVAIGLARFAYALILPAMRSSLEWSYAQAGWINTANTLGYLLGALLTAPMLRRMPAKDLFLGGMAATALALVASGLTTDFAGLLGLRLIAGASGAMVFICGGALAATVTNDSKASTAAIAIYYGGAGLGILLSGIGLPWLLAGDGIHAWKEAWLALGLVSFLALCPSYWTIEALSDAAGDQPASEASVPWRLFLPAIVGYFLFGLGYIAYMTFVIAWMRNHGAGTAAISLVWGALGFATVLSPIPWRRPLASWRGGYVLGAANFLITLSVGLPLASSGLAVMLLSAVLFGGAGMINSAAITALAKKSLAQAAWGPAVRGFTVVFATGQSIGPVLAGVIADRTGSLEGGLGFSALILLCSAVIALFQCENLASQ